MVYRYEKEAYDEALDSGLRLCDIIDKIREERDEAEDEVAHLTVTLGNARESLDELRVRLLNVEKERDELRFRVQWLERNATSRLRHLDEQMETAEKLEDELDELKDLYNKVLKERGE
jgi:hypothetical protein